MKKPIKTHNRQPSSGGEVTRKWFLWTLLALIFIVPFRKGLYWPLDRYIFALVVFILGLLWVIYRFGKSREMSFSLTDLAGISFVLFYAVGLIRPASMGGSVSSIVTWGSMLVIFWMWASLRPTNRDKELLAWTIIASSTVLAIVGLAVYSGVYNASNFLIEGRIAAGFEYPNATASLYMVGLLVSILLGYREQRPKVRLSLSFATSLLIPAFLLTLSRGAWVATLLVLPLLVLLFRKQFEQLLGYVVPLAVGGVLATAIVYSLENAIGLILSLIIASVFAYGEYRVLSKYTKTIAYVGIGVSVLLAVSIIAVAAGSDAIASLLPERFSWAVSRLSSEELFADARFVFYGDGLRAVREAPLLGYGGGAWKAVYHKYQSYHYGSARAHSDPLDVLMETGGLGLLAYSALVILALSYGFRKRENAHIVTLLVAAVAIVIHSFGEALLGFPAMYVILFSILGVFSAESHTFNNELAKANIRNTTAVKYAMIALLVGAIVLTSSLTLSEAELLQLNNNVNKGRSVDAYKSLNTALRLNPWSLDIRLHLIDGLWNDPGSRGEVYEHLLKARKYEPYDPRLTNKLGHFYQSQGDFTAAVENHKLSIILQPKNVQNYEALAYAAAEAALELKSKGITDAQEFLDKVQFAYNEFLSTQQKINPDLLKLSAEPFRLSPIFSFSLGQASAMRGQLAEAEEYLLYALDSEDDFVYEMAIYWLARVYEKTSRSTDAARLIAGLSPSPMLQGYSEKVAAALP